MASSQSRELCLPTQRKSGNPDYFIQGRKDDIGAFDSPKNPGIVLGEVMGTGSNWLEVQPYDKAAVLHNGDGLCY